jgi:Nucleotidyltransferase of unknown function (DUF6036)
MKRSELEHVIRASGAIADDNELVIIGSQSILGQYPDAPAELLVSMETDLYPRNKPELAELVDGSIGEGSFFHEQFGYYAQGVGPETAVLPAGWEKRLVEISNENTNGVVGLCLEVHDLAISKYVAGRPKDLEFTSGLARAEMTDYEQLGQRLAKTKIARTVRPAIRARIDADFRNRE